MKKWICIILTCFLLISVPVRGYAVSPVVWGIGEEVILPFLLALLGVQAKETVTSYTELRDYHDEVYSTLIENLSGLASIDTVRSWLFSAAQGLIDTDSVIWQKLTEYACSNYVSSSVANGVVSSNNALGVSSFQFNKLSGFTAFNNSNSGYEYINTDVVITNGTWFTFASDNLNYVTRRYYDNGTPAGWQNQNLSAYTYNGLTVYHLSVVLGYSNYNPQLIVDSSYNVNKAAASAWLAFYGDTIINEASSVSISDAFDNVLSASEKDDIIDGTSVVQLYNPDALQNGLEIMPGGDPEDDPNLKKIPFAVTADWWNFLQQFGQGVNANQYVNAYNALNGLDGSSVGRISDAYDSLGIANIVGSAANVAEGIVNLTDNNIYPNAQTVADAVNGTIPQILDPESPDSGIDNESPNGLYKLPDLRDYFPFCIPFDLIHLLSILAADPVTPEFVIKLSDGNHEASTIASLEVLESVSQIVRNFELAGFCLGLILITRGIIRG